MAQVSTKRIYGATTGPMPKQRYEEHYSEATVKKAPEHKKKGKELMAKLNPVALAKATKQVTGEIITTHREKGPVTKIATKNIKSKHKTLPVTLIVAALICISMFALMIFNYARAYELSVTVSRQQSQLDKLNSKLAELEEQTETELSSTGIVDYTKDKLGFVPKDQLSSKVISTGHKDVIRSVNAEEKKEGIGTLLSSLYGMIKNIFE